MTKTDFTKSTPCGGCCDDCTHFINGECNGCIASNGKCILMWQDSHGVCKVYKCCQEHNTGICGLCADFLCCWLEKWFDGWNKNGIEKLKQLRDDYRESYAEK